MKTFAIRNGDFVVGPGGYDMVQGSVKVKQDLAVALREPLGCDRFHPRWGTTLPEHVGRVNNESAEQLIQSEITRVINNYTVTHGEAMVRESNLTGRSNYSTADLVAGIQGIQVRQSLDRFSVRIFISTGSGETVAITRMVV